MYIGKTGDGTVSEDGIYVLLKEVIDNSIDEFTMGYGKRIALLWEGATMHVRDYGRGIPLGKLADCVSKINTGGKYDDTAFQKSVGLHGVGLKITNALCTRFIVTSIREGKKRQLIFCQGKLKTDSGIVPTVERGGTLVQFDPDDTIFEGYAFVKAHIGDLLWRYAFLNKGLTLSLNEEKYYAAHGLLDLLQRKKERHMWCYPIVHLHAKDIEVAFGHGKDHYGEETYAFVNGQLTVQGGTHLQAFRESFLKTLRSFYKEDFHVNDIRTGLISSLSIRMQSPIFESQTKTKLGSQYLNEQKSVSIRAFVHDFLSRALDNFLHTHKEVAVQLLAQIKRSQAEREEMVVVRKQSRERSKKANLHNKKIRDCHIHYNDKKSGKKEDKRALTMLFITEGNSASGSITQCRDPDTQAVFSMRGKPLNCFGMGRKLTYENEEFNLLQHALNIAEGIAGLRYNYVVLATDADVDGMHIRLLMLTFFFQFYPALVEKGHLYVLETPLFRVRSKKETYYCYAEEERQRAVKKVGQQAEITRFKGLGEISPGEFRQLIGEHIRLTPIQHLQDDATQRLLSFYMGKNTKERQQFIIEHLRAEKGIPANHP